MLYFLLSTLVLTLYIDVVLSLSIDLIHFIPGIYPHGVSFFTPVHFRVPSLIFGSLEANYLAENGVSGTF